MSKSVPQIIMLNHAASVNADRAKQRSERRSRKEKEQDATDPVVMNNKRLSELTSEEMASYYSQF